MGRCWGFFAFWVASSYTIGRIAHFRHLLVGSFATTTTADLLDIPFFHFPFIYLRTTTLSAVAISCCLHKRLLFEISRIPLGDGCFVAHVLLKVRIIIILVWILFWLSLSSCALRSTIANTTLLHNTPPIYRLEGRAGLGDAILVLADPAITCCRRVVGVFYSFLLSFAKTPHYTYHIPFQSSSLPSSGFSFFLMGGRGRKKEEAVSLVFFYLSTIFYYRQSHHHYRVLYLLFIFHQLRYIIITYPRPPGEKLGQRAIVIAAPINQTIFLSLHVCLGCRVLQYD